MQSKLVRIHKSQMQSDANARADPPSQGEIHPQRGDPSHKKEIHHQAAQVQ